MGQRRRLQQDRVGDAGSCRASCRKPPRRERGKVVVVQSKARAKRGGSRRPGCSQWPCVIGSRASIVFARLRMTDSADSSRPRMALQPPRENDLKEPHRAGETPPASQPDNCQARGRSVAESRTDLIGGVVEARQPMLERFRIVQTLSTSSTENACGSSTSSRLRAATADIRLERSACGSRIERRRPVATDEMQAPARRRSDRSITAPPDSPPCRRAPASRPTQQYHWPCMLR